MSLVRGSSNAPWKNIPPHCCQHVCSLRTRPWEWLLLIPQSQWLEAGRSNWLGPLFSPWLSYHRVLSLTPVLCHLRGPQITCRLVPLSLLHTNSSTLFLSLVHSLWGPLIHTVVCSHRILYCRYVMQNERRDDLSFSTACVSNLPAATFYCTLLAPRRPSSSAFLSQCEPVLI